MNLTTRSYQKGDYDTIISIWEKAGLPYKIHGRDRKDRLEQEMTKGHGTFFFALEGQREVGVVLVTHDGRKGWINRLAVLPEYRQKGIGKYLVSQAEHWLDQQGIEIYACLVESYNDSSYRAFQKMGYVPFEGIHYLTKRKYPEV